MAMSKDAVELTLPACEGSSSKRTASINAAKNAFGLSHHEVVSVMASGRRIRCRPSQFARFMIYRNEFGGENKFIELNPKLVVVDHNVLDVRKTPAGTCGEGE